MLERDLFVEQLQNLKPDEVRREVESLRQTAMECRDAGNRDGGQHFDYVADFLTWGMDIWREDTHVGA